MASLPFSIQSQHRDASSQFTVYKIISIFHCAHHQTKHTHTQWYSNITSISKSTRGFHDNAITTTTTSSKSFGLGNFCLRTLCFGVFWLGYAPKRKQHANAQQQQHHHQRLQQFREKFLICSILKFVFFFLK